jgi:murein DD-endopeptidase MepM/ murein hydrolase activator NlpD
VFRPPLTVLALVLASSCGPSVLSPYGDLNAVSPNPDGSPRPRDRSHDGVDFGPASKGDAVIASADGLVVSISEEKEYGIDIRIVHDGAALDHDSLGARYLTSYLHLQTATVHLGERVTRGQKIGEVGLFWGSGGVVHVHWRLCRGDCSETLDPIARTVGCYKAGKRYPDAQLALTYPLHC